jgi:hypothetical protein
MRSYNRIVKIYIIYNMHMHIHWSALVQFVTCIRVALLVKQSDGALLHIKCPWSVMPALSSANGFIRPGQKQNTAPSHFARASEHSPDAGRESSEREMPIYRAKTNQCALAVFVVLIWPRARAVNVTVRRAELKSTNGHEASGLHELRGAFAYGADELCTAGHVCQVWLKHGFIFTTVLLI